MIMKRAVLLFALAAGSLTMVVGVLSGARPTTILLRVSVSIGVFFCSGLVIIYFAKRFLVAEEKKASSLGGNIDVESSANDETIILQEPVEPGG